jgi:hypothetical protein
MLDKNLSQTYSTFSDSVTTDSPTPESSTNYSTAFESTSNSTSPDMTSTESTGNFSTDLTTIDSSPSESSQTYSIRLFSTTPDSPTSYFTSPDSTTIDSIPTKDSSTAYYSSPDSSTSDLTSTHSFTTYFTPQESIYLSSSHSTSTDFSHISLTTSEFTATNSFSTTTRNPLPFLNISTIFSSNNSGSQLNVILESYEGDLSSCLANCSNQGICVFDLQLYQYICQCNQFRTGQACQLDTRPCSSNPCLNGGICNDTNNLTSFECTCQMNLFYGQNCENKFELCLNSTICISSNQGLCQMNETKPICKCFKGYSGANCEIISTSLVLRKAFINVTAIIAIGIIVIYVIMILCFDFTKYFLMKKTIKIQKKKELIKKKRVIIKRYKHKIRHSDLP